MCSKLAAVVALPLMIMLASPAHAEPNYATFLQAIAGDGIVIKDRDAIVQGHAVCGLIRQPNGGSLWDAGQLVLSMHPDWRVGSALDFADRSVQNICPNMVSSQ